MRAHDLRRRLRAAGPWALDALLALAATAAGVLVFASVQPPGAGSWTEAAYALVVAHSLPIAVRRRFPLPVLAWALATGLAFAVLGFNLVPLGLSILIYVYTVASRCRRRVALAALAATEALLALVFLVWPNALGNRTTLLGDLLAVAAAWWLGDGTRRRHDVIAAARQRAAELERAREELARTVESANGRQESDSDRQDRRSGRSGRSGRSAGHGILGMRERAALYGGTLHAGPLPGGGFRVPAHLPVESGDPGGLPA